MNIIIMGPLGSGKGTQAKIISKKYSIAHVSTGDMMRSHIQNKTPIGIQIKSILDSGGYVNDDVTIEMLKNRLQNLKNESIYNSENIKTSVKGYILDGFPRTLNQAIALESFSKTERVIFLNLSDSDIIRRLSGRLTCISCGQMYHKENNPPQIAEVCDKCGSKVSQRKDDKLEVIENRLKIFREQTIPIIGYYKERNILKEVAGKGDIYDVNVAICELL